MVNDAIAELYQQEIDEKVVDCVMGVTKVFVGNCSNCPAHELVVTSMPGIDPLCSICFNLIPEAAKAYFAGDEKTKNAYKLFFALLGGEAIPEGTHVH